MAERAGFTVTMFLIDVSPSMGKERIVELEDGPDGQPRTLETTNLEWSLQFVKLKIQEMIYNGRKTDQCGVILFGTEDTENVINEKDGGYDHVTEFIPIAQPNAGTLAKLSSLTSSTKSGDPIDAIIVGIETQDRYLATRRKWTRKMVLLTDAERPIEIEDWEATADKMNSLNINLTIIGVDFDDDELPFHEEDKSNIKRINEEFFHTFVSYLTHAHIGNTLLALQEISRPEIKQTKSALLSTEFRIGDTEDKDESGRKEEAVKIKVKVSKCTAFARPKGWKKFGMRENKRAWEENNGEDGMIVDEAEEKKVYAQLAMRTEHFVEEDQDEEDEGKPRDPDAMDEDLENEEGETNENPPREIIKKESLTRGYKYGSSFVPCPTFLPLPQPSTKRGFDFCGVFSIKNFRRDMCMGEVQYIWGDPDSPTHQVALSSIVQAMYEKGVVGVVRYVAREGSDPRMGVIMPTVFDEVDCFLFVQMPFADDIRKYMFPSLDRLVNRQGELVTRHPYLPTEEQLEAMDDFVEAMDLTEAGEKDEEGKHQQWFDTRLSYNPAIHRTKQALFHGAVVQDLNTHPLPPPHNELMKYFNPPKKVVKRARESVEECKRLFNIKEVPKRKIIRTRKDGHILAQESDEEDNILLLDKLPGPSTQTQSLSPNRRKTLGRSQTANIQFKNDGTQNRGVGKTINEYDSATESENEPEDEMEAEDEDELILDNRKTTTVESASKKPPSSSSFPHLPTPSSSSQSQPSTTEYAPRPPPGRIIGLTYPLSDFRKNIASGDLVSKAVEDFGWALKEIVVERPFGGRRSEEVVEGLKEMRKVCLEEDEIDAWNEFLPDLKKSCLHGQPGNPEFWSIFSKEGRNMSLISTSEAERLGGKSNISEDVATEFMHKI